MSEQGKLTILHKKETILNKKDTELLLKSAEKARKLIVKTPSKNEYVKALEVVQRYEARQKTLSNLQKDLSYKLQQFDQVKFKVDKKTKEVIFTGLHKESSKILLGKSVCGEKDEFELVIGKLIAVKKALHEDIEEVVKHVETKMILGGIGSIHFPAGIDLSPIYLSSSKPLK